MKKYEGLFQIGEVAALLGISRKMLLNYENHNLITPTLVDGSSGYRYFDAYAIARTQLILDLRRTGMSLADIGKYFKGSLSAKKQITLLKEQIFSAQKAIEQLEIRNSDISAPPVIREITLPQRYCICKDYIAKDIEDAVATFIGCYYDCLQRGLKFAQGGYNFCEFPKDIFDGDFYQLTDISMKICICTEEKDAPSDAVVFPPTKALSISFCGEYSKSVSSYELLKKYIKENNLKTAGYPREFYLEGNFDNNSDKNIVWIAIPIK